jgi:hypothetical protein
MEIKLIPRTQFFFWKAHPHVCTTSRTETFGKPAVHVTNAVGQSVINSATIAVNRLL